METAVGTPVRVVVATVLGATAFAHGSARGADRPFPPEPPAYANAPPPPPGPEAGRRFYLEGPHPGFPEGPRPGPPAFAAPSEVGRQDAGRRFDPRLAPPRFEPPPGRVCFDPAETREKIVSHRLADPFQALRDGRLQGEALRARLCRWRPDEFIYEVAVLLRDGRVVHIYMNARNGQTVGALEPRR